MTTLRTLAARLTRQPDYEDPNPFQRQIDTEDDELRFLGPGCLSCNDEGCDQCLPIPVNCQGCDRSLESIDNIFCSSFCALDAEGLDGTASPLMYQPLRLTWWNAVIHILHLLFGER